MKNLENFSKVFENLILLLRFSINHVKTCLLATIFLSFSKISNTNVIALFQISLFLFILYLSYFGIILFPFYSNLIFSVLFFKRFLFSFGIFIYLFFWFIYLFFFVNKLFLMAQETEVQLNFILTAFNT